MEELSKAPEISAIIEARGGEDNMRQVVVYRGEDEYWIAECPSLPGCVSQGKSKEEAITNIKEAIKRYVAALEEDKLPVPFFGMKAKSSTTVLEEMSDLRGGRHNDL
jgi:predicted RNase H-like HicB family nuclease